MVVTGERFWHLLADNFEVVSEQFFAINGDFEAVRSDGDGELESFVEFEWEHVVAIFIGEPSRMEKNLR